MSKLLRMIFLPFLIMFIFFILIGFLQPSIKVNYNGAAISFDGINPTMYSGGEYSRIIVPVDILANQLGAIAEINFEEKAILIKKSADIITLYDDKITAMVNGREKVMPVKAYLEDKHFYASVRFLSENLGKSIFWDPESCSMNIFDSLYTNYILDEKSKEYVSSENFLIKSDKLVFKNSIEQQNISQNYVLEELLNPYINKQMFNMFKIITDKSYYTKINYTLKGLDKNINPSPYVSIILAKTKEEVNNNQSFFSFIFYEKTSVNPKRLWKNSEFSNNAIIKLDLNKLYETKDLEKVEIDLFYENKLKLCLVALFGENIGLEASSFILEEYLNIRNSTDDEYNNYKKTRRFGNVKVDIAYVIYPNSPETIHIYFSYF